jgi:hypothetical protein|uniref:Ubiquinone oxidoreductase n=1 Tax=Phage sp. ctqZP6 TaxID=2828010 RepID=A0A8S5SI00_9VIRU|nr:MAG TPA: Ubiquinone oxidoreductase [Phage sp. ctqZP6]
MKLKVFNIELDGIDKCGKDSVRPYVFYLEPGKYLCRARGLISQIAYAKLYKRNIEWDGADYAKNTLFVLLEVNKHDWEIRCKLTNEPNTGFTYEEMTQAFKLALYELKERFDVPENHILVFNTSEYTPYAIADEIKTHLEYLNNQN